MTATAPASPRLDQYLRFERVDQVEGTERGLAARLHGERLLVELVAEDVVRLRISRGGTFDDPPTHAVCADPLAEPVKHEVEHGEGVVRLRTAAMVVTLGLDPFRV